MKPIGGFFELELPQHGNAYHKNAIPLSTGRACLNLIIKETRPKKIYIPYYTCDALLDPIITNHIPFEYYGINPHLDPLYPITLRRDDYFLYINYFGIKTKTAETLFRKYKSNYILDNTHAFFKINYTDIWAFNSARKFFGVPDGAYLYSPYQIKRKFKENPDVQYKHLINRLLGKQKIAYRQFSKSEELATSDLYAMSELAQGILSSIDYNHVARTRKDNFNFLHYNLGPFNQLNISSLNKDVPLSYPFLPDRIINKKVFYDQAIYIPTLWKRSKMVKNRDFKFERDLAERLLPLPVDQRYSADDLSRVVDLILSLLNG